MAVWQRPSKIRGKHQGRHAPQSTAASEACRVGDAISSTSKEADLHYSLEMRTPEQTALIALRGLLEAKEMHIQKIEVGAEMLTEASSSTEYRLTIRLGATSGTLHSTISS